MALLWMAEYRTEFLVKCPVYCWPSNWKGLTFSFHFQLTVYCEGEVVTGCPVRIRALPDLSQIMFSGIDPCAIGSIVEVLVRISPHLFIIDI